MIPYGRSASAQAFTSAMRLSTASSALTLVIDVPLMPMDALARAYAFQRSGVPGRTRGVPRVAAFDRPVEVVPMVQEAVLDLGRTAERQRLELAVRRQMPEQRKAP